MTKTLEQTAFLDGRFLRGLKTVRERRFQTYQLGAGSRP
jgi:hypothetical protein